MFYPEWKIILFLLWCWGVCASHANDFPSPLSWEHFPFILKGLEPPEISGVAKLVIPWMNINPWFSPSWRESRHRTWDIPTALWGRNPNALGICSFLISIGFVPFPNRLVMKLWAPNLFNILKLLQQKEQRFLPWKLFPLLSGCWQYIYYYMEM